MDPATRRMQFVYNLRSGGVKDARVLSAMEEIPRDAFLQGIFADKSNDDLALPINCGQTISAPSVVGLMTQALAPTNRSKVLEIGTGSGYQAAVLSHLSRRVYSLERHKELARTASETLETLGISNVVVMHKDGTQGLLQQAPFDRIMVTAAAEDVPGPLLAQLAPQGILVMPVGIPGQTQTLIKVIKTPDGLEYKDLQDVRFVPLMEGTEDDSAEK